MISLCGNLPPEHFGYLPVVAFGYAPDCDRRQSYSGFYSICPSKDPLVARARATPWLVQSVAEGFWGMCPLIQVGVLVTKPLASPSPLALTQHPHHTLDRSPHSRHLFLDN